MSVGRFIIPAIEHVYSSSWDDGRPPGNSFVLPAELNLRYAHQAGRGLPHRAATNLSFMYEVVTTDGSPTLAQCPFANMNAELNAELSMNRVSAVRIQVECTCHIAFK